ncbi:hypothetical protein [Pollutibacter soli]|uniref:hypothetical protein n=1 Tax=Pollutibacter soli TaxID=3034157 RepID=UPI003013662B
MPYKRREIILHNPATRLQIALDGGAITDFHLTSDNINPLTFRFSKDQMPVRNKNGAAYQGHFLCLGRWGEPSPGEKAAGLPDHGQFANQEWQSDDSTSLYVHMSAGSKLEGLSVDRKITLDPEQSIYVCTETVHNPTPLGKVYNMVQHPTIAAPFLNEQTRVYCNAERGFHFLHHKEIEQFSSTWPMARMDILSETDMRSSLPSVTSVHSYVVDESDEWGWILAWSPVSKLLLGYIWKRSEYPWINLWRDYHEGAIRYRGLEFGTSGVHQPFSEIMTTGCFEVFGQKTFDYIDAGEFKTRKYWSFLVRPSFEILDEITLNIEGRQLTIISGNEKISILLPWT